MVAALDTTAPASERAWATLGLFWYMAVNHEIVGIDNSTNKLDACLASAPDDPCLTLSFLVPCDVRSRHEL